MKTIILVIMGLISIFNCYPGEGEKVGIGGSTGGESGLRDLDGNLYTSVIIGTQEWMVENLRTTKFADGSDIQNVTLDDAWALLGTSAYCWYENDIQYKDTNGALYNGYVVLDVKKLVEGQFTENGEPSLGWRVPHLIGFENGDWWTLSRYIGGSAIGGAKLKEIGFEHWREEGVEGTDNYGFKGVASGFRFENGQFTEGPSPTGLKVATGMWGDYAIEPNGDYVELHYINGIMLMSWMNNRTGMAVRCMRDI
ncbi:MAG TPA: FISUMP domain-containing protein [Bacteroidales bacterium]|nr:FISUMP domain-containing protein [Bacteroidales bacterium]